jgi:Cu/Ag efflux protein CusF
MKTCLAIMAGVMSLAAGSASAHHSFSVFDMQEEISITGTVKEVQWTNPHIWIWVDVPNEDGEIVTWGLEGMSPNFLARRGWTRNTLKTGDKVTVSLRPLKSGEPGGMFMQTTAPDGTVLSMGGGREGDNN